MNRMTGGAFDFNNERSEASTYMLKRTVASAVLELEGRQRLARDEKDEIAVVGTSPPRGETDPKGKSTERQQDDELIDDPQLDRMITKEGPPSSFEKEAVPHTPTSTVEQHHQKTNELKEAHLKNLRMQTEKAELQQANALLQAQIDSLQEVNCAQRECLSKTLQDRVDAENQIMELKQEVTRLHDQHEAETGKVEQQRQTESIKLSQPEESLLVENKRTETLQAEKDMLHGHIALLQVQIDSLQEENCAHRECVSKTLQDRVDAENQIMELKQEVTQLQDQHGAEAGKVIQQQQAETIKLSQPEESLLVASKRIETLQVEKDMLQEVNCAQRECLSKTLQDRVDAENQIMELKQAVTQLQDQHGADKLSQLEESLVMANKRIETLQAEKDMLQGYIAKTLSKLDVKLDDVKKNTQASSSLVEEQNAMIAESHKKLKVKRIQL